MSSDFKMAGIKEGDVWAIPAKQHEGATTLRVLAIRGSMVWVRNLETGKHIVFPKNRFKDWSIDRRNGRETSICQGCQETRLTPKVGFCRKCRRPK